MSLTWSAYRLVAPCLGAMAPAARYLVSPQERPLWGERLGRVRLAGGCHAWVHAASLGEALGVGPMLDELRGLQSGARFWLTASTRAGRSRLEGLGCPVSLAPMDAPQVVRRFFDGIQPQRLILLETELWPHWLLRARAEGVGVMVVSARLSARSVERYRQFGPTFRSLLGGLDAVLCQTHEDAERWIRVGATPQRVAVTGNLKNDALPVAAEPRGAARAALGLDRERPLLVLASVRPGEVRLLARAWRAIGEETRARWQVVAVPRHPRASAEMLREARESGLRITTDGEGGEWRWDDRLGVLARYYAVADAAFVGGSLLPYGGHNPLEPAACGAAVLIGPFHASQKAGVATLAEHRAVRLAANSHALGAELKGLLEDEAGCRALGAAARQAVLPLRGAARRSAAMLAAWRLWPVA
jgi:3-deoxy-D-manno-octulosonic-acid transferase